MTDRIPRKTLTVDEVAEQIGVCRNVAYREVAAGRIPSIKVGGRVLVPRERFERWLDGDRDSAATKT